MVQFRLRPPGAASARAGPVPGAEDGNPGPACPGHWAGVWEQRVPQPLGGCKGWGGGDGLCAPQAQAAADLAWGPALREA